MNQRTAQTLRTRGWDRKQIKALLEITRVAAAGRSRAEFLEQVTYSGRRLAKLNISPHAIWRALRESDRRIDPSVRLALNDAFYQVRAEEAQAFFDLFRAEVEATGLADLLERFAEILARTFHASGARLYVGQLPEHAKRRFIQRGSREERLILDAAMRGCYRSYWSVPFFSSGKVAGLIQLGFPTRYEWLPRELELLDAVAERCLAAAEKARLTQEVRELAARIFEVEEQERRRISRELHDEAGQSLLFARLQLEMMEKSAPPEWKARVKLAQTRAVVERTILEIRRILSALSPAVLEQLGLAAAIRQLTTRFRGLCPALVRLRIAIPGRLKGNVEAVTYRLLQECYQNIARHARASHIKVSVRFTDGLLELKVEDDGVGFDLKTVTEKQQSFGLAGMRQRVTLMGGNFTIRSAPGQGTSIAIRLPGGDGHASLPKRMRVNHG